LEVAPADLSIMRTLALLLLILTAAHGKPTYRPRAHRSSETRREFQRQHPCPSTGKTSGPCAGYVKGHIVPLACGGTDSPNNMQWQTVAAAKAKDRVERKGCGR
jgi:hypothetical protein